MISKGDIVEVISNPRPALALTQKYVNEPADVIAVINTRTFVLKFCDEMQFTVDISCIKEL